MVRRDTVMKRRIYSLIKKALNDVVHGRMDRSTKVLPENGTAVSAWRWPHDPNKYTLVLTLRGDDVPEVKE